MEWRRFDLSNKNTWPPPTKSIYLKVYSGKSYIMGVGFFNEYQAPYWETGIKIYGNTKGAEKPKFIEWLDESNSIEGEAVAELGKVMAAFKSLLDEIDNRGYRNDFTKEREILRNAFELFKK